MYVDVIERCEMKAAVLKIPMDGHKVREAWKASAALLKDHHAVTDREHGYVFIPEWQWNAGVTDLWVGMLVSGTDDLPDGLEVIDLPAKRFARIKVKGDRASMEEAYSFLDEWFEKGPYKRDMREGSISYEMNSLHPVNPFDIPADQIAAFDFDIYAPILDEPEQQISQAYPGVLAVEVRQGGARKIVGVESFFDRSQVEPSEEIPEMWKKFMPRTVEIADLNQPAATVGLYSYKPPFGPEQNFHYLAGSEVAPDSEAPVPEGMIVKTIPESEYVVITYRGKAADFEQVWDYFHGVWFPQQTSYDVIDDFEFERHDERYLGDDHEQSVWELHFPVRKRSQES